VCATIPTAAEPKELQTKLRTQLAKLIVTHVMRPKFAVVQAWLWLAAEAQDMEDKRRCLNAVLALDPSNEPASLGVLVLDHRRREN